MSSKVIVAAAAVAVVVAVVAGAIFFTRPRPTPPVSLPGEPRPLEGTPTEETETEETAGETEESAPVVPALYPWIDVHVHPVTSSAGQASVCTGSCLDEFLAEMESFETRMALLLPPPRGSYAGRIPPDEVLSKSEAELEASADEGGELIAYVGGGYLLQPHVVAAESTGTVSEADKQEFESLARDLAESGAVAFGEMALLHITPDAGQFQSIPTPAAHPLLTLLADLAAEFDLPIDVHMEAVEEKMTTPIQIERLDPEHPDTLEANIAGFEAWLAAHANTKFVWAHGGWDNTGQKTVELMDRLLRDHANLYVHLQLVNSIFPANNVLDEQGQVRPDWLEHLEAFPDRYMIGTDRFLGSEEESEKSTSPSQVQDFLHQLPDHVASQIACENAKAVYSLPVSCE
jgi:hypothetical protein